MREYYYRHDGPSRSHDVAPPIRGGDVVAPAKAPTPEEQAEERIRLLRRDVEAAAHLGKTLREGPSLKQWQDAKADLAGRLPVFEQRLGEREADAKATEKAGEAYAEVKKAIDALKEALRAPPPRAVPPVAGELALEPAVVAKSAHPDDVLAWAAGLGKGERKTLAERMAAVSGSKTARDQDPFATALSNHLAAIPDVDSKTGGRLLSKFLRILDDPRRFDARAYERERAKREGDGADGPSAPPAGVAPGSIDVAPSYEETRGTIDIEQARQNREAREGSAVEAAPAAGVAPALGAGAKMAPGSIDAAPSYEETRGTIDIEQARQNREAREGAAAAAVDAAPASAPAEVGARMAPGSIDAAPYYEETRGTIDIGGDLVAGGVATSATGDGSAAARRTGGASSAAAAARATPAAPAPGASSEAAVPAAVETALRALLDERIGADDTRAQAARKRRLLAFCRSIASPHREALAARIERRGNGDALAERVHGRLHPATVRAVIGALQGDAEAFGEAVSPLTRTVLDVSPGLVVTLDRDLAPTSHVRITPRAPEAHMLDVPAVSIRWRREPVADPDAAGAIDGQAQAPDEEAGAWLAGAVEGDPYVFRVRDPGRHRIRCEIAEEGVVIAVREVEVTVRQTTRSEASSYRADHHPGAWLRASDAGVDRKRGEDLGAAMSISGEDLSSAYAARREQLATDATLSADQRAVIADEVATLEFAAAQRAELLPAPPATGETVMIGDWVLSEDPTFLRAVVEGVYASSDADGVEAMIAEVERELRATGRDVDPNDVDDPLAHLPTRIVAGLRSQWSILRGEIGQFIHEFTWRARQALHHRLDESYHVVAAELERYTGTWTVDPLRVGADDPSFQAHDPAVEMPKLQRAAAELVSSQRLLDDVRARYAHAVNAHMALDDPRLKHEPLPALLDPEIPAVAYDADGSPEGDLPALMASLERMIAAAEAEHSQRILLATAEHPFLASYKVDRGAHVEIEIDGLRRITEGNAQGEIEARAVRTLRDIRRTREAVEAGRLNVWKQPRVIDLARAEMLVAPGSVRDRAIHNKMAAAQGGDWTDWALLALTVALAVAAAIPTGGSSVAAGVVAVAEVSSLGASIYLALESLEEYQIGKAAAGTDVDKARAIAASEPSLLWVAIDIAAVGLDLHSMNTTFRRIRDAWRGARAGGSIDEAMAVVHGEHHAGRIGADAVGRLERELGGDVAGDDLAARVADDLVEDADDLAGAARTAPPRRSVPVDPEHAEDAGRALSGPRRVDDRRARVRPEDHATYERRLGVPVETNPALEDGVRVHFVEAGNGDLVVTRVEMGPLALVDDVLAHQRTIARLTRYNGITGELRRIWDQIVALVGGRVDVNPFRDPPFGPGSRAFESFEEMKKLDDLLRARRAAWSPEALHADVLDDEIRFLQGELTRHAELVRDARETLHHVPGRGFVERPAVGQRTGEATAAGWKLPDQNPEHYYYRVSDSTPGAYELALKPSAPKDAPSLHAEFEIVGGAPRPTGRLVPRSERTRAVRVFSELDSPDEVMKHLRESPSTAGYLDMLTRTGDRVEGAAPLATDAEIAETIAEIRKARASVNDDDLRHALKERFRKRVEDFITDGSLDNAASYQRMRQTLDGLGMSDKGNLAEVWYQRRYAKDAERHVPIDVRRADPATGDEWLEERRIDLFDGKTATEVKSGAGPLGAEGKEQFLAYVQMAEGRQRAVYKGKPREVQAIKYVFTDAAGARKNLPWMAEILLWRKVQFAIEVFDEAGRRNSLRTVDEIKDFLRGAL